MPTEQEGYEGWICEAHPEKPFPHDDCAGPGMPSPEFLAKHGQDGDVEKGVTPENLSQGKVKGADSTRTSPPPTNPPSEGEWHLGPQDEVGRWVFMYQADSALNLDSVALAKDGAIVVGFHIGGVYGFEE